MFCSTLASRCLLVGSARVATGRQRGRALSRCMTRYLAALVVLLLVGCGSTKESGAHSGEDSTVPTTDSVPSTEDSGPRFQQVSVRVRLDGEPVEGARVAQGGRAQVEVLTDAAGEASLEVDRAIPGDLMVVASHPEARHLGAYLPDEPGETVEVALQRFDTSDNPDYRFQPAGSPANRENTEFCAHCHVTLSGDWYDSPHRSSASNARVQDLYAGTAASLESEEDCVDAGGRWWQGIAPGSGAPADRCYLGDGALPALNEDCGSSQACDGIAEHTGMCADCHAPAIDGQLGGRDLLEATGLAYEEGVTCEVCHKTAQVDPGAPAPGVAGKLEILRPSEPPSSPLLGSYEPLLFGPYLDVVNPLMGSVDRPHFREASLCAGCHAYDQPVLVPGAEIDAERWPEERLPIHQTYAEWQEGAIGSQEVPCQACHMPPAPEVGNAADLYNEFDDVLIGVSAGWERAPGEVRHHSFIGPRQPESRMLELAVALSIEERQEGEEWVAEIGVRNVGAGHALPTGEPLRALLLLVEARCDGRSIAPTGGDVISELGGALASRQVGEDWSLWPEASVGDQLRVLRQDGWREDPGPGRFGDGSFTGEERGLPRLEWVGQVEIRSVDGSGQVQTDAPLPEGDVVFLVQDEPVADGDPLRTLAGAPGHAFAKVLVDAEGRRHVPHFLAVDIASDNRLMPHTELRTEHRFAAECEDPEVGARLLYREAPRELALERGWDSRERIVAELWQ